MKSENVAIFTLSIILTALLILVYTYFIAIPLNEASRNIAQILCQSLGVSCL